MKFVVIGGTGLIGSKAVSRLERLGHEVVVAAPSTGIDILTGQGLDDAMAGTEVVIDLANSPSFEDEAVLSFFRTAGRNILEAETRAGVGHHVALSVVGTDKLAESGYFRGKIAQEALIRESSVPYSIIHSTQFFEFLPGIIKSGADGDQVRLPSALVQPISSDEVADAVVRIATSEPANGIVEIAGPEAYWMADLAQRYAEQTGDGRKVVGDVSTPYFGAKIHETTLIPAGEAWLGKINFDRWMSQYKDGQAVARK